METNRINYITIQQYLDGSLDKEAMHELEKQALDDPFLADALEGYSHISKPASRQLSLLQTQLEERIAKQQENKNVFSFSWQRLSVAAAAGVLFVTASILFWIKDHKSNEQLASQPKQVEVTLTPKDSIDSAVSNHEQAFSLRDEPSADKVVPERKEDVQIAAVKPKTSHQESVQAKASNAPVALDEVTIVGYGTQQKRSTVGSISTIQTEQLRSTRAGHSAAFAKSITGKVISTNGEPLPGVSVQLKNAKTATVTNVDGEFNLKDSVGGVISLAYLGFAPKEVKAEPGVSLTVALDEDTHALNEVVVVGYGGSKELKESPEPAIGWSKYKQYLQNSIKPNQNNLPSGRVVVTFSVDSTNQLSNFKIKKGLDDKRNQEAVRLIKEGPAWNRGKQVEASVTIRFK